MIEVANDIVKLIDRGGQICDHLFLFFPILLYQLQQIGNTNDIGDRGAQIVRHYIRELFQIFITLHNICYHYDPFCFSMFLLRYFVCDTQHRFLITARNGERNFGHVEEALLARVVHK